MLIIDDVLVDFRLNLADTERLIRLNDVDDWRTWLVLHHLDHLRRQRILLHYHFDRPHLTKQCS